MGVAGVDSDFAEASDPGQFASGLTVLQSANPLLTRLKRAFKAGFQAVDNPEVMADGEAVIDNLLDFLRAALTGAFFIDKLAAQRLEHDLVNNRHAVGAGLMARVALVIAGVGHSRISPRRTCR